MTQGFKSLLGVMVTLFVVGCEHASAPPSTSSSKPLKTPSDNRISLPVPRPDREKDMEQDAGEDIDAAKQEVLDYQNNPVQRIEENDPDYNPLPPERPQGIGCDGLFCP